MKNGMIWRDEPQASETFKNEGDGLRYLGEGDWAYLIDGEIVMVHPYPVVNASCYIDRAHYSRLV